MTNIKRAPGIGHVLSASEYGTSTIIEFGTTEGRSTYRVVEFVPAQGVRMHTERSRQWCAGAGDVSPSVGYGQRIEYDAKCNWCWLGYSHSERAHEAKVSK